jgi:hypothetical protein
VPFLVWLQQTAIARWVGESPSIWAYPTILTLHTVGLGIVVGVNAIVDLRVLGAAPRMSPAALRGLYPPMWAGFVLNAVTGTLLFAAGAEWTGVKPLFYIKLTLIAAALALAVVIRRSVVAGDARAVQGARAKVLAVASLVLWIAAIFAGRYTAYVGS